MLDIFCEVCKNSTKLKIGGVDLKTVLNTILKVPMGPFFLYPVSYFLTS